MKMELIVSSETSARNTQTPGIYPKESKLHYTMVFITINALHVSGGSSAHHQELKTVYTTSGICRGFSASCRPSVDMKQLSPTGQVFFMEFSTWRFFSKFYREISIFIKTWQELGMLRKKTHTYLWYPTELLLLLEMFQIKFVEKIKILFMFNEGFFCRKLCHLWDDVK
jgi:hypothetical protein